VQRILIVEDFREARAAMVDILMDDYEVSEAASVAEALEAARGQAFDLLLSDIRLEGPDGIEGLEKIREIQPKIKAILITGFANEEAPSRAIRLRVDDYLYKPFTRQALLHSVGSVMGGPEERARYHGFLGAPPNGPVLTALEPYREAAFGAFYVGVRSHKLTEAMAKGAYERLEMLEKKRSEGMDRPTYEELVRGYQYVAVHVGHLDRNQTQQLARSLNAVESDNFARFYKRLREGMLTPELALLAPAVRGTSPGHPELAKLRAQLWD
jgi:CheY-like chemotaxis protein